MVGQLGSSYWDAADLAAPFQFEAERRVEAVTFTVEELAVCGLREQGVVEGIATAHRLGVHQHGMENGRPQGIGDDRNR
jgi:hypothetical protein